MPLPDGRSPVEASVVDAVSREPIPWAVLELHAAGAAAESLGATQRRAEQGVARRRGGAAPEAKRIFRAQTDGAGCLSMRLPGGKYEVWAIGQARAPPAPARLARSTRRFRAHWTAEPASFCAHDRGI